MSVRQWPGVPSAEFPGSLESHYSEGQLSGYRWYDKNGVKPAFPFGYGTCGTDSHVLPDACVAFP